MKNLYSSFVENVIFKTGDILLGTQLLKQLQVQRSYTHLSTEKLLQIQQQKLHAVLAHATQTCKFYQPYASAQQTDALAWLSAFPIISKKHTTQFTNDMVSNQYDKNHLIKYETSGSSGIRSMVYIDKKEQSTFRAILLNWWEWNGYHVGNPILQTGISPDRGRIKSIKDKVMQTIYVDAFGMTEEDAIQKLLASKKYSQCTLFGYASSLYALALIAEKHQLNITFRLAMSQGDKLFEHYRKKISAVFSCDVVEDYGLNEGIMIGQKKDLPYYYYYTPAVYIEIVDQQNQPVPDGTMGRIIATKLDGFAMPLIRYDTGDLGIMLPKEKYPAKRDLQFPLIESVVGRNTDIIQTPDGKTLIVHTFTGIFEFFSEIQQFQVVQKNKESITIRYIPAENFENKILHTIEALFRQRTHSNIPVHWEQVEYIAPSKSGKPQIIVNEMIQSSLTHTIQ